MQLVVAAYSLAEAGGSETYLVTLADHLQRLGHDVWLHAAELGRSSDAAQRLGLRVTADEALLPTEPDALLVQDAVAAYELTARYPLTRQVFVAHSDTFDVQLPPQLPDVVATTIVLYDRVERRVRALAQPPADIVRLAQPVDVDRFKPTRPLSERPRLAMTLGNYLHGERLALLRRACERAGIELRHVGWHGEGERQAEEVLNDADIVFGKARVIVEAMACGRAAYVFDHNGGDGWVTAGSYAQLAPDNFGGQSLAEPVDEGRLVADLGRYAPEMGVVNRDLALLHHSASKHAAAVAEILRRVAATPRAAPVDGPLRELARLIRLYHRADVEAFSLRPRIAALAARAQLAERSVADLEGEVAARDRQIAKLEAALAVARADSAAFEDEAARLGCILVDLTGSQRWRLVQALFSPADRLRRSSREPTAPAATRPPPAPFVVGVARSGTTLLRLQLDAHPDLAIGPETGFGLVLRSLVARQADPNELLEALVGLDTWPDLGLDRDAAADVLEQAEPWSLGAGLRALYLALAARDGKPRWGDKTPLHVSCMPQIASVLPEARFIHLIRDGRDVAASVRGLPFAPGDGSIEAIACDWRDRIVEAREDAGALKHYFEVRYERLVGDPEHVLRELCEYVALDFDDAMLQAHERASTVMGRLPERRRNGDGTVTKDERVARHAQLANPPDPARVGRWRTLLTADEVARFEAQAGDLLRELGYA